MTFNQVISRLNQIVEAHNQIRTFRYVPNVAKHLDEEDNRGAITWPLAALQDVPGNMDIGTKIDSYNFRLYLIDLVNVSADAKENEQEVMSDMKSVAKDLVAVINHSSFIDWKIASSIPYSFINEGGNVLYGGVWIDIAIQTPFVLDKCSAPIDDLPIISTMNIQKFTVDGTWVKPPGAKWVKTILTGAGDGAGSGQKGSGNAVGGGAGAAGSVIIAEFDPEDLTDTVSVTIGIGGAGGASVTTNNTNGNSGSPGTKTKFGGYISAGSAISAGIGGGLAGGSSAPGGSGSSNSMLTGIAGNAGGSGRVNAGDSLGKANNHACTGGGGGGGINAGVPKNGGNGQYRGGETNETNGPQDIQPGGIGGTIDGALNGTNGGTYGMYGTGGGGGASSVTGNAGNGGAGGRGAGGGGGGAARNDMGNSGAGGPGGDGYAIIITYL